ncbi:sensor domain-containing diguanylate cyclase [bacterium]|nr:sensor domain-containing diguanylate cyclase [bacterium]
MIKKESPAKHPAPQGRRGEGKESVQFTVDEKLISELKAKMAELENSYLKIKNENELLSERLNETHVLYRIAAMLNSTYDVTKLFQIIQSMVLEISFVDQFSLVARNASNEYEALLFSDKSSNPAFKHLLDIERELAEEALDTQKEIYVDNIVSYKDFVKYMPVKNAGSVYALPLVSQKRPSKVLSFHSARSLQSKEIEFLKLIAHEVAVAVDRTQVYQDTLEISIKDELTKIYNRRYFNDRILKEFHRAERYTRIMSLILIDIDFFKSFNDTYGHHVGDEVLKGVSHKLTEGLRDCDVLARYGGEEFIVILPETEKQGAIIAAEKLRSSIAQHLWEFRNTLRSDENPDEFIKKQITISLGVSSYPEDGGSITELMERADQNLYHAKLNGRNQVCGNRTPVEE